MKILFRILEAAGLLAVVSAAYYWFSTTEVVRPILLAGSGIALAGIPWLIQRRKENDALERLTYQTQQRSESK